MDVPVTQNPVFEQVTKVNQKPKQFIRKLLTKSNNDLLTPDDDDEDGYHHIHMSTTHV